MKKLILKITDYGKIIMFAAFALNTTGCTTAPLEPPAKILLTPGIYHRVEKGQTLWGISRMYNVDLDEVRKINHISDAASIEIGQLLLLPALQPKQNINKRNNTENFIWPLKGKVLVTFGQVFNNLVNKGINIQPYGTSNVLASRSGKVVFCTDNLSGFGKTIIIDHGDGFSTVYARNYEILAKPGDTIERSAIIAKVGKTSARDKNTYLHFEIRKGYMPQNPNFYLAD